MTWGSRTAALAAIAAVGLLVAANVDALPVYRLYLLKDTDAGSLADGKLDLYDAKHPNFPNITKAPSLRFVFPVASGVEPVQFLTAANETHPARIKGPVLVNVVPGPSPVLHGNLTATLVEVPEGYDPVKLPIDLPIGLPISDPVLPPPAGPAPLRVLATVNIPVDANSSKLPDPTLLVPPGEPDPADPAGYAQAVAGYEEAQLLPFILNLPTYHLVNVDVTVNATSRLALVLSLTQGDSPLPLPAGAFATAEYDSLLSLSYVFVPWYSPDKTPVKTTPTKTPAKTTSRAPATTAVRTTTDADGKVTTIGADSTSESKSSPGLGLLVLPALAALALLVRRRLEKT
jgi:MYXO-CTERM domain-containing protein